MNTSIKMFFLVVALAAPVTAIHAAVNQGGSTSTNFSCDVNTGGCSCSGPPEGVDCKLMKKNCHDGDFHHCGSLMDGSEPYCVCNMYKQADAKKPVVQRAPVAPARK